MSVIGKRIKEARKLRGITQKQLAEAAGVATGTIQQYELGLRTPKIEIVERLSNVLNVSFYALCEDSAVPLEEIPNPENYVPKEWTPIYEDELNLLVKYKKLDADDQQKLLNYCDLLTIQSKYQDKK